MGGESNKSTITKGVVIMGRRKGNILLGMNANEKRFMRKIVEVFEKRGLHRSEWPERKAEALTEYRDRVRRQCSECMSMVVEAEIARQMPKVAKPVVVAEKKG